MNALKCRTSKSSKVQNLWRLRVHESLKAHMLDLYNACARMLERHVTQGWRYSFDRSSAHACTPSCSNRWCFAVHQTGIPDRG